MKKNIATIMTASVLLLSLASCKNNGGTTVDTSSIQSNIAKTWFANGNYVDNYFDDNYKTVVYDPVKEDFNESNYMRLHAATDVKSTLRMTKTAITKDSFGSNKVSRINYLQTSAFNTATHNQLASYVSEKVDDLKTLDLGFESNIQTSWQKDLSEYDITEESLSTTDLNYLYVVYMPMFVRVYQNKSIAIASFICVPVYTTVSTEENGSDNAVVQAFKDKIVSLTYANSVVNL
jgi:hypothetical protein